MSEHSLRIIFMGTPDFAVPSLKKLCDNGYTPIAVYTQPDRINGRGKKITPPPVKALAMEKNIPVYQPETLKTEEEIERIREMKPDLLVVIAYGRILPKALLDIPAYGAINVHGSLLPEYRGAAPIQRAIIDGKKETGTTIMKLDAGMDTGDMLVQKKMPIGPHMTAGELFDALSLDGADLLLQVLDNLPEYMAGAVPQDASKATYAEKITKPMGRIDWTKDAVTLDALIRGMYPNPGTFTFFRGKRLKIHRACVSETADTSSEPGTIVSVSGGAMGVQTGRGILTLTEVQPENHKKMLVSDFINGHQVKINDKLEY